ncbi:MAG: cupin domain-containing protein [Alphaproteobacteria bacterium]|nr:cupin domain-containing protein [Alphaproteobacteria bacterium]
MSGPKPAPVVALDVPPRVKPSRYPEPFASRMAGRLKRGLADAVGPKNIGVNLTILAPGGECALLHRHSRQDEFVYVLEGEVILVTEEGEATLRPGMCVGFPAAGAAHQLVNRSQTPVHYLEVGDRTPSDMGTYPRDDLAAHLGPDGEWVFTHKDGTPYS